MHSAEHVCVIGLGYIGLPTAVVLAQAGKRVTGVDVNPSTVDTINSGRAHIIEPDLDGLLHHVVEEGSLVATTEPEPADVFVIAVPTPFKGDHEPDLSYVQAATTAIAPHLREGNLVVLESTVPPGATEALAAQLRSERPDLVDAGSDRLRVHVAHCPERVLPGRILIELVENDRVAGGTTDEATAAAQAFYSSFVKGECVATTARTAELAKLAENAFRDVNIAYANELSMIAHELEVDPWELISIANRHPRVNILRPGPGVGGHCIAVDPWFIAHAAPEHSPLIRAARQANLDKTTWTVDRVLARVGSDSSIRSVLCLGLAYKPDVDDLRESPAVEIVRRLATAELQSLLVVEPNIDALPPELQDQGIKLVQLEDGLREADLVIGLVAHREFKRLGGSDLPMPPSIDTAGIWT